MAVLAKLAALSVVLAAAFLLTTRVIPWVFVRCMRLLGFRMKLTPITQKRIARFKRIKRGYVAFLLITTLFVASLFLELLVNSKALYINYDGRTAYPAVREWLDQAIFVDEVGEWIEDRFPDPERELVPGLLSEGRLLRRVLGGLADALQACSISSFYSKSDFGQLGESEVDYRRFARYADDPEALRADIDLRRAALDAGWAAFLEETPVPGPDTKRYLVRRYEREKEKVERERADLARLEENLEVFRAGRASCIMPLYPFSPDEERGDLPKAPLGPSMELGVPFGTDYSNRDVLALMLYGFRISLSFALVVAAVGYSIGVVVGGIQGYYSGWVDIVTQRVEEIWGSIPFLFTIMIIGAIMERTFLLMVVLLIVLRSWLGITYYVRGEFYREKAKDYVQAAIGAGVSDWKIITRHILPNALVPVVTFAPFGIVAYIGSLVSLDYLGFGLPPGTPSWGALLRQGLENVKTYPHLTIVPTLALATTLYCVVMVGEAVREAFDPKVFSRLR